MPPHTTKLVGGRMRSPIIPAKPKITVEPQVCVPLLERPDADALIHKSGLTHLFPALCSVTPTGALKWLVVEVARLQKADNTGTEPAPLHNTPLTFSVRKQLQSSQFQEHVSMHACMCVWCVCMCVQMILAFFLNSSLFL